MSFQTNQFLPVIELVIVLSADYKDQMHLRQYEYSYLLTAWKLSVFGVFLSEFPHIRTEYGEIRRISQYSVRMWENADYKTPNTDTFHAVTAAFNVSTLIWAKCCWFQEMDDSFCLV